MAEHTEMMSRSIVASLLFPGLLLGFGCEESDVPAAPPPPPPPGVMMDASLPDTSIPSDPDAGLPDAAPMPDAAVPLEDAAMGLDCPGDPRCEGASAPGWALEDFQPMSMRYSETYGLDAFRGNVVVLSFHAGWCSGCVVQAGLMQELLEELQSGGYTELQFVSINATDAMDEASQQALIYRRNASGEIVRDEMGNPVHLTTYPVFQDTSMAQARIEHRAQKNDFFIYNRMGELTRYLSSFGPMDVWLDLPSGRANVRAAILESYGPLP